MPAPVRIADLLKRQYDYAITDKAKSNLDHIMHTIHNYGPLTIASLRRLTGMQGTSVQRIIQHVNFAAYFASDDTADPQAEYRIILSDMGKSYLNPTVTVDKEDPQAVASLPNAQEIPEGSYIVKARYPNDNDSAVVKALVNGIGGIPEAMEATNEDWANLAEIVLNQSKRMLQPEESDIDIAPKIKKKKKAAGKASDTASDTGFVYDPDDPRSEYLQRLGATKDPVARQAMMDEQARLTAIEWERQLAEGKAYRESRGNKQ